MTIHRIVLGAALVAVIVTTGVRLVRAEEDASSLATSSTVSASSQPVNATDEGEVASAEALPPPAPPPNAAEQIVIVGSRRAVRSVLDSPTPVDSIKASDFTAQGTTDIDGLLRSLVPSYNVNPQPISDAGTLMRPANLRGLPPDSTVVLVNGKRRHRGSVITFQGGGISDGSQGVDLASIPALALQRVDVLRDGAAAQYGSDAIAGVLNFVLRDDAQGVRLASKVGSTFEGDGTAWSVAANIGLPLTDMGFFNFTIEYGNSDPTSRSIQRTDAAGLIANGNTAVPNPAQIWGSPEVSDDLKIVTNTGITLTDNIEGYAFGNFARRDVLGGFFYRNPTNRGGVFSADGGDTILVGDLTPDDGIGCPIVDVDENGNIDQAALDLVIADPNCFAFNELFPGGFTPQFGGRVVDMSLAAGVRGRYDFGLRWDLSASFGSNETTFRIINTINATLGPDTPTEFTPGRYREADQTINLDVAYDLKLDAPIAFTFAGGAEYRKEVFTVVAGDVASFEVGPLVTQGFSIGSNGFPGFSPDIAGNFSRENVAGYLEVSSDLAKIWQFQLAGRIEHFDSFGTQATIKVSNRVGIDIGSLGSVAIRGSVGTGFRAPSAGQANVSNVSTVAGPDGVLVNRGTIPPTNPIAQAVGGAELSPEKSLNISGGIVLSLSKYFELTADYYNIEVTDRISQSATQMLTPEQAQELEDSGIRGATDLSEFRFFTNAFDTRTQGIDVVATSRRGFGDFGNVSLSLAYNWNETTVEDFVDGVIDDQRIAELEDSLPRHRLVGTVTYLIGDLRVMTRLNYFGSFFSPANTGDFQFGNKVLVDAELGYTFLGRITAVVGAQNIFNTFPDENPRDFQGNLGAVYPENAPTGFNGGFYYGRLMVEFP